MVFAYAGALAKKVGMSKEEIKGLASKLSEESKEIFYRMLLSD